MKDQLAYNERCLPARHCPLNMTLGWQRFWQEGNAKPEKAVSLLPDSPT